MSTTPARHPFAAAVPALVTPSRTSRLGVRRFRSDEARAVPPATFPREDAHVLVFQVRAYPTHDFWLDGRHVPAAAAARGALNIFDLDAAPTAHIVEPFDSLHFHIPRPALDDIAEEAGAARVGSLHAADGWGTADPVIAAMQDLVIAALGRSAEGNTLFDDHLAMALHAHIAQTYGGMTARPPPGAGGLAPWQAARAKALIAANLDDRMPLAEVARECGLSPSHFARAFRASVGATPHGWLQARRVDRAQDLLLAPHLTLAEVALACGFADQSHLTRIFRRLAGTTPGAWRRLRRTG